MKYILQVFTGFGDTSRYRAEEMIDRIQAITAGIRVEKVIIGWSREAPVYRKLSAFLHERGIQMLLWLPAFSETAENARPEPAEDIFGKAAVGPEFPEDASFHFVCPSSGHNARIVTDTYEQFFQIAVLTAFFMLSDPFSDNFTYQFL